MRHRFPTKTTYLAIRKNRFQTIADTCSELAIRRRQQNQHPAILPFRPDPPLLKQGHRVTPLVLPIHRLHRNHGNLRLRLLLHLLAKSVQPRLRSRIQNSGKIIDVVSRAQRRNGLGSNPHRRPQHNPEDRRNSHQPLHSEKLYRSAPRNRLDATTHLINGVPCGDWRNCDVSTTSRTGEMGLY